MRGKSPADVLSGRSKQIYGPDTYIGGEMGTGKWLRKADYKAVSVAKPYGPAKWQLFNLKTDPGETRDLASTEPQILHELIAAWENYAKDVGVVQPK